METYYNCGGNGAPASLKPSLVEWKLKKEGIFKIFAKILETFLGGMETNSILFL